MYMNIRSAKFEKKITHVGHEDEEIAGEMNVHDVDSLHVRLGEYHRFFVRLSCLRLIDLYKQNMILLSFKLKLKVPY